MIVQWTTSSDSPLVYFATWQGMKLRLMWEKPVWRVWVNGKRVKQHWDSVTATKAGVDAVVLKLLSNGPVVPVEQVEHPCR